MTGNLIINVNNHLKLWSNSVGTNIYPIALWHYEQVKIHKKALVALGHFIQPLESGLNDRINCSLTYVNWYGNKAFANQVQEIETESI